MEQHAVRKTFKYRLKPTPEQERELVRVLGLCRALYNTALEQRIIAYQRRHVSLARYQQEAELKDIRAEMPEYAAIHSHVLQDVLARLDKTYQAFFRRLMAGEKAAFLATRAATAGIPSPTKSLATGPRWTMGSWFCPR
jgi:putative transposase